MIAGIQGQEAGGSGEGKTARIDALRKHLEIYGVNNVEPLLEAAWHDIEGSGQKAMAVHKLRRLENPRWEAPVLTFTIERHGGTVKGSTRAELQTWQVNLATCNAEVMSEGHRQLVPQRSRVDVDSLAREVASAVAANSRDDPRLNWKLDEGRDVVQLVLARILTDRAGVPKRTLEGRTTRLRNALQTELMKIGWEEIRRGWYSAKH